MRHYKMGEREMDPAEQNLAIVAGRYKDSELLKVLNNIPDDQLLRLYEVVQNQLSRSIDYRNNPNKFLKKPEVMQREVVEPDLLLLGKIQIEIDERHKEKGLPLPPTMEERGL